MYVGYINLPEMVGFFIWYLRCAVDMLIQILYDKTEDVGKTSSFSGTLPNHHILAYPQLILAKSPQNK